MAESSAKYAILTNGDEYWFYDETQKLSIKEAEPVRKIKISDLDKEDVRYLNTFTRNVLLPVFFNNAVIQNANTKQIVLEEFFEKNGVIDAIQSYFDTISVDSLLGKDVNDVFYDYVNFCKNSNGALVSKKDFVRRLKEYFLLKVQTKSKNGVLYNILVNKDYLEHMEVERIEKWGKRGKDGAIAQNTSVFVKENFAILDYIKAVRQDTDKWGVKLVAKKFHMYKWGNYKKYAEWCEENKKPSLAHRPFWRSVSALAEDPENCISVLSDKRYDLADGGKCRVFRIDPVVATNLPADEGITY